MNFENEQWKIIDDFFDYEVSDYGRVRSLKNGKLRLIKGIITAYGYVQVSFSNNGKVKNVKVHRLVLTAFVGPCPNNMEGCHNDGNRQNNKLQNLRWASSRDNEADKIKHCTDNSGTRNGRCILTEQQVLEIRSIYSNHKVSQKYLSNKFNVSAGTISDILLRKSWRDL